MSMPQRGGSGQQWDASQGSGPQSGAPGQPPSGPQPSGQPPQYGQPQYGQQEYGPQPGQQPQYGQPPQHGQPPQYGQGGQGQDPSGQSGYGPMQGRPMSPVNEAETRVLGRRIVQYVIDFIISGIVFWLLSFAFDRGTGVTHGVLVLIQVICDVAWYFLYWAYVPYVRNGQTIGMSLLEVRVISADGGPASLIQLFGRSILLVLFPVVSPIVGFFVALCSRYRQRTGDHMARTMVVKATVAPLQQPRQYAGAGQSGTQ